MTPFFPRIVSSSVRYHDEWMYEPPPDRQVVMQTRRRAECFESRLVLSAVGIRAEVIHHVGWWYLVVRQRDAEASATELAAYQRENAESPEIIDEPTRLYGGAVAGVLVYVAVILWGFLWANGQAFGFGWLSAGRTQAAEVTRGELWRCVTALTLHADVQHLASNIVFGGLFGFLAGRLLGGGFAWLTIVIAGSLGNLINAWVQAADHRSIGASTAVFAALGIVVSHALMPANTRREKALRRWAPLIGGVVLLGMTGVGGERTDVTAHVTGFLAGLLIGWAGCRVPRRWLEDRRWQMACGAAAFVLVVIAWGFALAVAG